MTRTQHTVLHQPAAQSATVPSTAERAGAISDPATGPTPARGAFAGAAGLAALTGASLALARANVRYWSTVAPVVREQLVRWEQAAHAIPDPALRALALGKLRDERFNALLAATLATLAPSSRRARVVEAIVALQVLYDYVDAVTEQPMILVPAIDGRALLAALIDAVTLPSSDDHHHPDTSRRDYYYRDRPRSDDGGHVQTERANADDGGYLQALIETVSSELARLPNAAVIAPVAGAAAARCAEAQVLNHEASRSGIVQLRRAATAQASGTGLGWQEYLAGATASVLAIGALIVAAADSATTRAQAEELDGLYLSIGALSMLDSLVDQEEDIAAGQLGYVQYYAAPEELALGLATLARDAARRARVLPNGAHHIVTLVGIVAYYASAPTANTELARPLIAPVRRELAPLITPTLTLMRAWRLAKRVRHA
jgi:tetraprenyl-beta-curcumene synthase